MRAAAEVRHGRRGGPGREHDTDRVSFSVGREGYKPAGGNLVGGGGPPSRRRPRVCDHTDAVVHTQAPRRLSGRRHARDDLDVLGRESRPLNLERPWTEHAFPHRQRGGRQRSVRDGAEPRDTLGVHVTGEASRGDQTVADQGTKGQRRRSRQGEKSNRGGDNRGNNRAPDRSLPFIPDRVSDGDDAADPRPRVVPASDDRGVRRVRYHRRRVRDEHEYHSDGDWSREPSSHPLGQRLGRGGTLGQAHVPPVLTYRPGGEHRGPRSARASSRPSLRLERGGGSVEEAPRPASSRLSSPPPPHRSHRDPRGDGHVDEAHRRAQYDRHHVPHAGSGDVRAVAEPFIRRRHDRGYRHLGAAQSHGSVALKRHRRVAAGCLRGTAVVLRVVSAGGRHEAHEAERWKVGQRHDNIQKTFLVIPRLPHPRRERSPGRSPSFLRRHPSSVASVHHVHASPRQ